MDNNVRNQLISLGISPKIDDNDFRETNMYPGVSFLNANGITLREDVSKSINNIINGFELKAEQVRFTPFSVIKYEHDNSKEYYVVGADAKVSAVLSDENSARYKVGESMPGAFNALNGLDRQQNLDGKTLTEAYAEAHNISKDDVKADIKEKINNVLCDNIRDAISTAYKMDNFDSVKDTVKELDAREFKQDIIKTEAVLSIDKEKPETIKDAVMSVIDHNRINFDKEYIKENILGDNYKNKIENIINQTPKDLNMLCKGVQTYKEMHDNKTPNIDYDKALATNDDREKLESGINRYNESEPTEKLTFDKETGHIYNSYGISEEGKYNMDFDARFKDSEANQDKNDTSYTEERADMETYISSHKDAGFSECKEFIKNTDIKDKIEAIEPIIGLKAGVDANSEAFLEKYEKLSDEEKSDMSKIIDIIMDNYEEFTQEVEKEKNENKDVEVNNNEKVEKEENKAEIDKQASLQKDYTDRTQKSVYYREKFGKYERSNTFARWNDFAKALDAYRMQIPTNARIDKNGKIVSATGLDLEANAKLSNDDKNKIQVNPITKREVALSFVGFLQSNLLETIIMEIIMYGVEPDVERPMEKVEKGQGDPPTPPDTQPTKPEVVKNDNDIENNKDNIETTNTTENSDIEKNETDENKTDISENDNTDKNTDKVENTETDNNNKVETAEVENIENDDITKMENVDEVNTTDDNIDTVDNTEEDSVNETEISEIDNEEIDNDDIDTTEDDNDDAEITKSFDTDEVNIIEDDNIDTVDTTEIDDADSIDMTENKDVDDVDVSENDTIDDIDMSEDNGIDNINQAEADNTDKIETEEPQSKAVDKKEELPAGVDDEDMKEKIESQIETIKQDLKIETITQNLDNEKELLKYNITNDGAKSEDSVVKEKKNNEVTDIHAAASEVDEPENEEDLADLIKEYISPEANIDYDTLTDEQVEDELKQKPDLSEIFDTVKNNDIELDEFKESFIEAYESLSGDNLDPNELKEKMEDVLHEAVVVYADRGEQNINTTIVDLATDVDTVKDEFLSDVYTNVINAVYDETIANIDVDAYSLIQPYDVITDKGREHHEMEYTTVDSSFSPEPIIMVQDIVDIYDPNSNNDIPIKHEENIISLEDAINDRVSAYENAVNDAVDSNIVPPNDVDNQINDFEIQNPEQIEIGNNNVDTGVAMENNTMNDVENIHSADDSLEALQNDNTDNTNNEFIDNDLTDDNTINENTVVTPDTTPTEYTNNDVDYDGGDTGFID